MARTSISRWSFFAPRHRTRPTRTFPIRWACARSPDARRSEAPVPFRTGCPAKTKKVRKFTSPVEERGHSPHPFTLKLNSSSKPGKG
eukprot:scaffold833_cov352-Pavlova_lutheri.AAC.1